MKNYKVRKVRSRALTTSSNESNIGIMNWIKRKLRNWLREDNCPEVDMSSRSLRLGPSSTSIDEDLHNPMRFTIYNAQGGKIVEVRTYDRKRDHWDSALHVIESNDDFGNSIAKIIFTESLKRGL
jgi:hypothetical protein